MIASISTLSPFSCSFHHSLNFSFYFHCKWTAQSIIVRTPPKLYLICDYPSFGYNYIHYIHLLYIMGLFDPSKKKNTQKFTNCIYSLDKSSFFFLKPYQWYYGFYINSVLWSHIGQFSRLHVVKGENMGHPYTKHTFNLFELIRISEHFIETLIKPGTLLVIPCSIVPVSEILWFWNHYIPLI